MCLTVVNSHFAHTRAKLSGNPLRRVSDRRDSTEIPDLCHDYLSRSRGSATVQIYRCVRSFVVNSRRGISAADGALDAGAVCLIVVSAAAMGASEVARSRGRWNSQGTGCQADKRASKDLLVPSHPISRNKESGRGGQIRTDDFLLPKQALYQAELRPAAGSGAECVP